MKSAKCLSKTRQQHSLLRWLVVGLGLFAAKNAFATEYYVSPTGSDSGAGTQAAPFATVQKANDSAAAGDTIWMRAGTYNCTSQITLSKSGTSDTIAPRSGRIRARCLFSTSRTTHWPAGRRTGQQSP